MKGQLIPPPQSTTFTTATMCICENKMRNKWTTILMLISGFYLLNVKNTAFSLPTLVQHQKVYVAVSKMWCFIDEGFGDLHCMPLTEMSLVGWLLNGFTNGNVFCMYIFVLFSVIWMLHTLLIIACILNGFAGWFLMVLSMSYHLHSTLCAKMATGMCRINALWSLQVPPAIQRHAVRLIGLFKLPVLCAYVL